MFFSLQLHKLAYDSMTSSQHYEIESTELFAQPTITHFVISRCDLSSDDPISRVLYEAIGQNRNLYFRCHKHRRRVFQSPRFAGRV